MSEDLKIYYDAKQDILYLAKQGEEQEVVELAPGVSIELEGSGNLIGVEVFKASTLLKDVIGSIRDKLNAA
jgi:uncharacterized protein YuzE